MTTKELIRTLKKEEKVYCHERMVLGRKHDALYKSEKLCFELYKAGEVTRAEMQVALDSLKGCTIREDWIKAGQKREAIKACIKRLEALEGVA